MSREKQYRTSLHLLYYASVTLAFKVQKALGINRILVWYDLQSTGNLFCVTKVRHTEYRFTTVSSGPLIWLDKQHSKGLIFSIIALVHFTVVCIHPLISVHYGRITAMLIISTTTLFLMWYCLIICRGWFSWFLGICTLLVFYLLHFSIIIDSTWKVNF